MKLDILKPVVVFEGRNKVYGAYELRKSNRSTTIKALIIGFVFSV
jgi:protein TonB